MALDANQRALKEQLDALAAVGAQIAKHLEQAAHGLTVADQMIQRIKAQYGLIDTNE